jgi:hypothetical protein
MSKIIQIAPLQDGRIYFLTDDGKVLCLFPELNDGDLGKAFVSEINITIKAMPNEI